jgi:hypothetical protein
VPRAPGAELVDQPRLADARLAGHDDELRMPVLARAPALDQPRPLAGAPDERGPAGPLGARGHDRRLAIGRRNRRRCRIIRRERILRRLGVQERLVHRPRGSRRHDAELGVQRRSAGVVDPQRPRPVAAGSVQPHEQPVGGLAQRVLALEALRVPDRLGVLAAGRQLRREAFERLEEAPAQPLARLQHPVVVAAFQQVTSVPRHCLAERVAVQRSLERGDVEPERRIRAPLERPLRHLEEPIRVGQRAPQVV